MTEEKTKTGGVRIWDGEVLVSATCRRCLEVIPADKLSPAKAQKGGKRLACLSCFRQEQAEWYEKNKERLREQSRQNYRENIEDVRRRSHDYRVNNRDARLQYEAEYRAANRETLREYHKNYVLENAETERARAAEWRKSPRGRAIRATSGNRRRANKYDAACGCVNAKSLEVVWNAFSGQCVYCSQPAEHYDHVEPLSRGGRHCLSNMVPACAKCNLTKNAKSLQDFLTYINAEGLQIVPLASCGQAVEGL